MSGRSYDEENASPWATPAPTAPTVESALEKERIIKDIVQLRDGLRGLLVRVTQVEGETERLAKDNEMLSVYIDNLFIALATLSWLLGTSGDGDGTNIHKKAGHILFDMAVNLAYLSMVIPDDKRRSFDRRASQKRQGAMLRGHERS